MQSTRLHMSMNSSGNQYSEENRKSAIAPLAGILAFALLMGAGCAAPGRAPVHSAVEVPRPEYTAGATYVYDNGSWETIRAVAPEEVTWRSYRGDISSGSPDFTHRRTTWETRTRSGTRHFRERRDWAGVPVTTVWPLAPGKTARYIESGSWRDEDNREHTYETHWRLEVVGQERIRVKAGNFDTWKIVGRRFSAGDAFRPSRLYEKRIWYYAPAVGHYVKMEGHYLGRRPDRSIELLAVIPPVENMHHNAQTALQTSFQEALEKMPSGDALKWNRAELGLSGTTTPTATFKLASGDYCRQYVQHLNRSGEDEVFFGLACRTDAGRWEIPRR
jgi:hypothetical protein